VEPNFKKGECHRPCYVSSFLERECHAKGLLVFRLSWKGIPSMVLSRKIKHKKARGAQTKKRECDGPFLLERECHAKKEK